MGFEPTSLRDLVSLAAVFWMSRDAPLKELSFGGALRDIRKTAARETIRDLVRCTQWRARGISESLTRTASRSHTVRIRTCMVSNPLSEVNLQCINWSFGFSSS